MEMAKILSELSHFSHYLVLADNLWKLKFGLLLSARETNSHNGSQAESRANDIGSLKVQALFRGLRKSFGGWKHAH